MTFGAQQIRTLRSGLTSQRRPRTWRRDRGAWCRSEPRNPFGTSFGAFRRTSLGSAPPLLGVDPHYDPSVRETGPRKIRGPARPALLWSWPVGDPLRKVTGADHAGLAVKAGRNDRRMGVFSRSEAVQIVHAHRTGSNVRPAARPRELSRGSCMAHLGVRSGEQLALGVQQIRDDRVVGFDCQHAFHKRETGSPLEDVGDPERGRRSYA